MNAIILSESAYRDKVMGCWLGKNAGGTLGAPIEKMWGNREPFDLSFYIQDIPEGGAPNDDLEIQLIWLQALEECGLDLTCRDLAEYWLNHINYNPDEYGFHKLNLRAGLCPPVSGWYNNPFKHNMGCPIRSEIWACIAPALPHVAVAYAWHDAVCDHAGGESVYGEMFNAALEAAAFVISDRDTLLDIGLSVIPTDCLTAQAIRKARKCHASGMAWRQARDTVMEFAYNINAQYSPINLGFQTIGWLYGEDFGDALRKAVNCGWDTDCTGATLGAILGIIHGASALPEKWLAPLGRKLAITPEPGIINFVPPKDVDELADRTIAIGRQVLAKHYPRVQLGETTTAIADATELVDFATIKEVHARPQNAVHHRLTSLDVLVAYPESPCIAADSAVEVDVTLRNRGAAKTTGTLSLVLGEGLESGTPCVHEYQLEGHGERKMPRMTLSARDAASVLPSNKAWLEVLPSRRPAVEAIPVVVVGARKWLVADTIPGGTLESSLPNLAPDTDDAVRAGWRTVAWPGNELPIEPLFGGKPGVLCLRHYIWNPYAREVRMAVANNHRMQLWVNGVERQKTRHPVPCHPAFWGDCDPILHWDDIHINCRDFELPAGWSHVAIAIERADDPLRAFFNISYDMSCVHGCDDIEHTRFPWEALEHRNDARNYVEESGNRG